MPPAPRKPQYIFTRESVRRLDRCAIDEFGLPGIVLMENACAAIERVCIAELESLHLDDPFTLICCGPGANGGDGLGLARRLHNAGRRVAVLLTNAPQSYQGDAAINLSVAQRMGLAMSVLDRERPDESLERVLTDHGRPSLVVDALLGTGLDRPLRSPLDRLVRWINQLHQDDGGKSLARVLAVDIPTGLDCDTGKPLGDSPDDAIKADCTVTLCGPKVGFNRAGAAKHLGRIVIGDIGVPVELLMRFCEHTEH